jgi:hypothetical protein
MHYPLVRNLATHLDVLEFSTPVSPCFSNHGFQYIILGAQSCIYEIARKLGLYECYQ